MITRGDINPGYQCVQGQHSVADFAYIHPDTFKKWKMESNSIISLSAKSESDLLSIYDRLKDITPSVKFFEPDINQWTSICLFGTWEIRKSVSNLPLTLKNNNKS